MSFTRALPSRSPKSNAALHELFGTEFTGGEKDATIKEVITASIFLSQGEALEKLELCFDLYDVDASGMLDHADAIDLLCLLMWAPILLTQEDSPPLRSLGEAWGEVESLDPLNVEERAQYVLGGLFQGLSVSRHYFTAAVLKVTVRT